MISMFVTFSVQINHEYRGPTVLKIFPYSSPDFTVLNYCYRTFPTQLGPFLLHVLEATGSSLAPETGDPDQIIRDFPLSLQHGP
jgi:hypothetical protein